MQQAEKMRQQRSFLWMIIGLSAVVMLASGLFLMLGYVGDGNASSATKSAASGSGTAAVASVISLKVLNVNPHGDWFFSMQPGAIGRDGHWSHPLMNDDSPILLDGHGPVVGFMSTGYHVRWFSSINLQTYFLASMADGSTRRYNVIDVRTIPSTDDSLKVGVTDQLWAVLVDDDNVASANTSPTRTVAISQLVSIQTAVPRPPAAATVTSTKGG